MGHARAQIVLVAAEGRPATEIAQMVGRAVKTVGTRRSAYDARGWRDGPTGRRRPGHRSGPLARPRVYSVFERGERRKSGAGRVVRVGTLGLKAGSRSKLWGGRASVAAAAASSPTRSQPRAGHPAI